MKNKIVINTCYGGFQLSDKAIQWLKDNSNIKVKFDDNYNYLERHNPFLVKCVETLGKEASDHYSNIEVVEIDSNIYRIEEYDGREIIYTPNTEDYIIIK